jgi:hypothetical protein
MVGLTRTPRRPASILGCTWGARVDSVATERNESDFHRPLSLHHPRGPRSGAVGQRDRARDQDLGAGRGEGARAAESWLESGLSLGSA